LEDAINWLISPDPEPGEIGRIEDGLAALRARFRAMA